MASNCPVCDSALADDAEHCATCGFPTALLGRLDGPIPEPAPDEEGTVERSVPFVGRRSGREGPESEVNSTLARALEERTELLRTLDRDAPDVTGELCEAALNEAAGRASDAQQILRSAQARLDRETEELLGRHLENLESRGRALETAGLRLALEADLAHLAESIVAAAPATSVAALAGAERRMDSIESHWRGLQALIAQVASLRAEAEALGVPLPSGPDRLDELRTGLASRAVTERDLDAVAQAAAQTLMRLHDTIPPALERELGEHGDTLARQRGRSPRVASARRRHAEAVEHLQGGRLEPALRSLRDLRSELDELARAAAEPPPEPGPAPPRVSPAATPVPAAPPVAVAPTTPRPEPLDPVGTPPVTAPRDTAPAAPAPVAAPPRAPAPSPARPPVDAVVVGALMKKARSLAARVRTLPPDSEAAATAARQIHEATDLLRAGRYDDADAALSRLMRTLITTAPPS